MATKRNSTTAPLPGYQCFTIEITDAEAALLLAETAEQEAFSRDWSQQHGFSPRPLNPNDMAGILLGRVLLQNATRRQEGGAQ